MLHNKKACMPSGCPSPRLPSTSFSLPWAEMAGPLCHACLVWQLVFALKVFASVLIRISVLFQRD